jgi:hypothetical protein
VIAVYDSTNAAPAALQDAWRQFQQGSSILSDLDRSIHAYFAPIELLIKAE